MRTHYFVPWEIHENDLNVDLDELFQNNHEFELVTGFLPFFNFYSDALTFCKNHNINIDEIKEIRK